MTDETMRRALEAAKMAKTRLDRFADAANAGRVHYDARELKRKIGSAFTDFDEALAATQDQTTDHALEGAIERVAKRHLQAWIKDDMREIGFFPVAADQDIRDLAKELSVLFQDHARSWEAGREAAAKIADEMREKHGSPTGDAYTNGVWDQGVRIAQKIRALSPPAGSGELKQKVRGIHDER